MIRKMLIINMNHLQLLQQDPLTPVTNLLKYTGWMVRRRSWQREPFSSCLRGVCCMVSLGLKGGLRPGSIRPTVPRWVHATQGPTSLQTGWPICTINLFLVVPSVVKWIPSAEWVVLGSVAFKWAETAAMWSEWMMGTTHCNDCWYS